MESTVTETPKELVQKTIFGVLFAISIGHLLNDMIQSVITSVYPVLKQNYKLSFSQIGLITFTFQLTASLLQPFVGFFTDRKPRPFSLPVGMAITLSRFGNAVTGARFCTYIGCSCFDGSGIIYFSPGIIAAGTPGSRREKRTGTVNFPVRR